MTDRPKPELPKAVEDAANRLSEAAQASEKAREEAAAAFDEALMFETGETIRCMAKDLMGIDGMEGIPSLLFVLAKKVDAHRKASEMFMDVMQKESGPDA